MQMTLKNEMNAPNVVKTNQRKVISEYTMRYTLEKNLKNAFFVTCYLKEKQLQLTRVVSQWLHNFECCQCKFIKSWAGNLRKHTANFTGEKPQ